MMVLGYHSDTWLQKSQKMHFFLHFFHIFRYFLKTQKYLYIESKEITIYKHYQLIMSHENTLGFGTEHRKKNEQQEAWVANFLDTYFYPKISKRFERNYNNQTQTLGVDITLTGRTEVITIDEKASVEWCNVGLNKYSMELSLLSIDTEGNKKEIDGWYMCNNSLSNHIAIIFIDSATTVNDRFLTGSGITEATVVIINKQNFQNVLDSIGWNKQNLKKKNDMIRQAFNEYGSEYTKYINCGKLDYNTPHFFIREKAKEHGINVQFTQKFLIDNSVYSAKIKDGKITAIKK